MQLVAAPYSGPSRNDTVVTGEGFPIVTHGHHRILIVILADVLEDLRTITPPQQETRCPRLGIGTGVVDRHFVFERIEIVTCETLDLVKPIRVQQP